MHEVISLEIFSFPEFTTIFKLLLYHLKGCPLVNLNIQDKNEVRKVKPLKSHAVCACFI